VNCMVASAFKAVHSGWFFTHILKKFTVQETKSPEKISSGSVTQRDLIPALKG
jgi:hypothetical protein